METYGRRLVVDRPFAAALDAVTQALEAEGLDVIGRMDLRDAISRSTGQEIRRYVVLHAAAPGVLLQVVREDLGSPATLPAAVAVFELADGETAVIVSEPFAPLLADEAWRAAVPHIAAIADQECERVARALDRLKHAVTAAGGRAAAAQCRWATPTLLLDPPLCYEAGDSPWTCVRGAEPRPLDTTETCADCAQWEPRRALR